MLQSNFIFKTFKSGGSNSFILLLIPLVLIFVIYGYLLFISLRSSKIIKFNLQRITFDKVFYLMTALAVLGRIIFYIVIVVNMVSHTMNEYAPDLISDYYGRAFIALNLLPDLLFIPSFSIYGWLVLILFLLRLDQVDNFNYASIDLRNKYFVISVIVVLLVEAIQMVGCGVFWNSKTENSIESYLLINSVVNLILASIVTILQIVLHLTFSRVSLKMNFDQSQFKRANHILIFWSFGIAFKGIRNIIQRGDLTSIWNEIIENENQDFAQILTPLLLILELFVCEVIPLLLVNNSKLMEALSVKSKHNSAYPSSLQPEALQPLRDDLHDYNPDTLVV